MNFSDYVVYLYTLVMTSMKTKHSILPFVILCIFFDNNILPAQIAHVQIYPYIAKLPSMPEFPPLQTLSKESPLRFEDCSDLNETEQRLEASLKIPLHSNVILKEDGISAPKAIVAFQDEKPEVKHAHDEVLAALKQMQDVRTEYQENFGRLEEVYAKHPGVGKTGVIQATRNKIESEEYLLNVYLSRIKPVLKSVDDLLERYHYGDEAKSAQAKNLFRGAQQDEALILSDIIERLKLERITISNCARIAQQK